jgi:uncharacterized MAPEG superfamily protein
MTFPLASIGIAFVLIYLPRLAVIVGQAKQPEGFDNRHPRDQQARLTGWPRRAQAAHENALESFPAFAAAVLVSHVGGAALSAMTTLAAIYLIARTAYPFIYMADIHWLRTLVWFVGFGSTLGLFVLPLFS